MTTDEAQRTAKKLLADIYESREAATIADWLLEKLTGSPKIDRIINKNELLTDQQQKLFENRLAELCQGRPVQYVLEEADFMGLKLFVDENVLIPRPETEELAQWILDTAGSQQVKPDLKDNSRSSRAGDRDADTNQKNSFKLLDVGTGSGCIPIVCKLNWPDSNVSACDLSEGALHVAMRNARENNAAVNFFQQDILDRAGWSLLPVYDLIVSNPPYIPESDKKTMQDNVLSFEPHLALFTSDEDPYIFYSSIASFATKHLVKKGMLFFEIHESGADEVTRILRELGYENIELRNDIFEKPRMIRAGWPG